MTTEGLSKIELGRYGEELAAKYYEETGWEILSRNWNCREGELDIVAANGQGTLVFCEVKTRSSLAFGTPAEAVTKQKQQRIRKLARIWLSQHKGRYKEIRFEVAEVIKDQINIINYS